MSTPHDREPPPDLRPESGSADYRNQTVFAVLAAVGLSLYALAELGRIGVGVLAMDGAGVFNGGHRDPDMKQAALAAYILAALPQLVLGIPITVFYCMWVYRSALNARALGSGGFSITPGWAVGWYFIPFACLWMPFKAMSEIVRASRPDIPREDSTAWWDARVGLVVPLWWATWIIGHTIARTGHTLWVDRVGFGLDPVGSTMIPIGHTIRGTAAVLCCVMITRVTSDQKRLAHKLVNDHRSGGTRV